MCNDAVLRNNTLMGKLTEGALNCSCNEGMCLVLALTFENVTLTREYEAMDLSIAGF